MDLIRKVGIKNLLDSSSRATCGVFEREILVPASSVSSTKAKLRSKGFVVLGVSEPIGSMKKIWFNPAGVNL